MSENIGISIKGKELKFSGGWSFKITKTAAKYLKTKKLAIIPMINPNDGASIICISTIKEVTNGSEPTWIQAAKSAIMEGIIEDKNIKTKGIDAIKAGNIQIKCSKEADKIIKKADGTGKIENLTIDKEEESKELILAGSSEDRDFIDPRKVDLIEASLSSY